MPLFKALKAPKANVSIDIGKDNFTVGESISGRVLVTSDEEFEAKEVRVELLGVERWLTGGKIVEEYNSPEETLETRIYSTEDFVERGEAQEAPLQGGEATLSGKLKLTTGFSQQFPFQLPVPDDVGPSFRGQRRDGTFLERVWTLRGVLSVGGRPDVEGKKEIRISLAAAPQRSLAPPASA